MGNHILVELGVKGCEVSMKVKEMPEHIRGTHQIQNGKGFAIIREDVSLSSVFSPQLAFGTVYLQGSRHELDGALATMLFNSNKEAVHYANTVQALVDKYNNYPVPYPENERDDLVTIKGKKYSEGTVYEALKAYVNDGKKLSRC